jgi:hypothetical protein
MRAVARAEARRVTGHKAMIALSSFPRGPVTTGGRVDNF